MYEVMEMKYHKYPLNKIFKHANVLAKANKPSNRRLLDMTQ